MPRPRATTLVAAAAVALFLLVGLGLFGSTGHDDSHITYWVSRALAETGRLVNYNGERVEQSSSLAHSVLLALLALGTRVAIPTLGPLTSILFGLAGILLAGQLARRLAPEAPPLAELLVATLACFVYWAFGGLETTLAAASGLLVILEWDRFLSEPERGVGRAAAAALLFLTARPEAPLVLACVALVALAAERSRRAGRLVAVLAVESLLLFGFRWAYFGALFPNPVYTKATGIEPVRGLGYLWQNLGWPGLWLIVAVALGLGVIARDSLRGAARPGAPLTAALALGYAGFVVLTGGDWMTGGRFLAHFAPVLAVLAVLGVARALPRPRAATWVLALGVGANLWGTVALAAGNSTGRPLWTTGRLRRALDAKVGPRGFGWFELVNRVHLRDTTVSAQMVDLVSALRRRHPERTFLVMASQAGMVVYHAFAAHGDKLRFLDTCSLATRDFRSCLPASELDRRQVGLQLHFSRYFERREAIDARCGTRRPDIVFGLGQRGIEAVLTKHGYRIVFSQRGAITADGPGEKWFRAPFASDEFIAVEQELLEGVDFPLQPPFVWDIR